MLHHPTISVLHDRQMIDLPAVQSAIVPIGGAFAVVLWLGNAAYLYLSISFIQMLKVSRTRCTATPRPQLKRKQISHLTKTAHQNSQPERSLLPHAQIGYQRGIPAASRSPTRYPVQPLVSMAVCSTEHAGRSASHTILPTGRTSED